MLEIGWTKTLEAAGVKQKQWRNLHRDKATALAFGVASPSMAGRYFDIDAAVLRLMLDAAPGVGQAEAAALVRLHSDTVLEAIASADADSEPMWLIFAAHRQPDGNWAYNMGSGRLSELPTLSLRGAPHVPDRMVLVNVSKVLATVRANAAKAGLDLSQPFFPPPGSEAYEAIMTTEREQMAEVRRKLTAGELRL
jgi:hypothetical protein